MRRPWSRSVVLAVALLSSQMGHGDGCCGGGESVIGPPTESVCPPGSTLTYNDFGAPFMERYCNRCHDSALVGAARMGAPSLHDFDTLAGIKTLSYHVDETAAAGPAATNTGMPPDDPAPTMTERLQLGEWIACGMPE
jgi:cytochrome c5